MSLAKFEKDMAIIQQMDDEPNDVGGLTAAELKARFDEGGEALKAYINETLLPALEDLGIFSLIQSKTEGLKYLRVSSNGRLQYSPDGNNWVTILGASGADGNDGSDGADGKDGEVILVTYELPAATASALGGVMADPATDEDTQPVRIGKDGKLYTKPAVTDTNGGDGKEDSADAVLPDNVLTTAGGTMEGPLYLYDDPTDAGEAANKRYVDAAIKNAGGLTLDATLSVAGNAADAKAVGDAITAARNYTDSQITLAIGDINTALEAILSGEVSA